MISLIYTTFELVSQLFLQLLPPLFMPLSTVVGLYMRAESLFFYLAKPPFERSIIREHNRSQIHSSVSSLSFIVHLNAM